MEKKDVETTPIDSKNDSTEIPKEKESEKKDTPIVAVAKEILDSHFRHENEVLTHEIQLLKSQLKGMSILLKQNQELEKEVSKLCNELDQATQGVKKSGYLHKYREREIYYASKWGLRYFVLQANKLSYYGDENERRPRRTIDLSKCFIKDEGTKKQGLYHVFGIYINDESLEDTLVLRLSSEDPVDALQWIEMLEKACALENDEDTENEILSPIDYHKSPNEKSLIENKIDSLVSDPVDEKSLPKSASQDDWQHHHPIDETNNPPAPAEKDADLMSPVMLERVLSSNKVLKRSQSRSSNLTHRNLSKQTATTISGTKLSHLADIPNATSTTNLTPQKNGQTKKRRPIKAFPAYKPMHLCSAPSPLSSETRPGEYNYRGFFNLMVIILGLTHCDLIVNNISKYGLKFNFVSYIRPPEAVIEIGDSAYETRNILFHFAKAISIWFISVLLNYSIEKFCSQNQSINEKLILIINFIIGTFNIVLPCYFVWTSKGHPGLNLLYLFQSVILWMKLISYAHCNKDLRVASRRMKKLDREISSSSIRSGYSSGDEYNNAISADNNGKPYTGEQYLTIISEVKDIQSPFLLYPQNLTLKNLGYFLIAPTLCYQLNYPRTDKIHYDKLFWILFRLVVVAFAMLFAIDQYIKPTLETAIGPMSRGDILGILERLLKLSIPNTYVWLLIFYFYFHLWLNFLAEVTRFGDRLFYKDWWNAKTIDRYWRSWNLPVHHWVTRHLYYPLIRVGCGKTVATFVVFFFSAFLHELVISLPFHHISFHSFSGMMAQAPLIFVAKYLDRRYDNAFLGNAFFWMIFCIVGQPMGILMYYYDLYKLSTTGTA